MTKITNLVEKYIKENVFIEETLSKGLINVAALAEHFQPRIEKELGYDVKFTTINMAIRRFAENNSNFDKNECGEHTFFEDFTIRSNLVDLTVYKNDNYSENIKKICELIETKNGDYLTISEGRHEITILTNKKYLDSIISIFSKENVKLVLNDVGCVQIKLNEIAIQEIGVFYKIIKALTWEGINILEMVSTYTELTVIVSEDELSRSFEIVRNIEN